MTSDLKMFRKYIFNLLQELNGKSSNEQYNQIKNVMNDADALNSRVNDLKKLLIHAHKNVPFYFQRLENANVIKDDTVALNDFRRIPLLTKDNVRNHISKLTSRDLRRRKWNYSRTSGSTGEPLKVIQDVLETKWKNATSRYYFENIVDIDELAAKKTILMPTEVAFGGVTGFRKKLNYWLMNKKHLNTLRIGENDLERYLKVINSYKPSLIRSLPTTLYELCKFVETKGKTIYRPKVIVSSSQKLYKYMRETIEDVFGTKVYDFYDATETHAIAGECNAGLLHLFTFNNYVEILDEHNRPVREGEMGEVVVTPLHNYAMPLIRYELGDTAILGPKRCKCGNPLPTLKEVTGRTTDFIVKEDGSRIDGGLFIYLFRRIDWIKAFQVIQEDYRKIRIFVVPYGDINDAKRRYVELKIKEVIGKKCEIVWELVDEIPRSQSGKYLHIKSVLYDRH